MFHKNKINSSLLILFFLNCFNTKAQDTLAISIKPTQNPTFFNQFRLVNGLSSPNNARVDVFDVATAEKVGIPTNYAGTQNALSGNTNYLGIITYNHDTKFNLKEKVEYGIDNNQFNEIGFLQFALPYGLGINKEYFITFKVSLADNSRYATSGWGAYVSPTELKNVTNLHKTIKPQVSNPNVVKDKNNWVEIREKYTSTGAEKFITVGCFMPNYKTQEVLNASAFGLTRAYYYVADIKLIEIPSDIDKDSIIDIYDKCPLVFGLKKYGGCPDTDLDSIPDNLDSCPLIAGLKQFLGCPDTDADGIEDSKDKCPTIAGLTELNGCPQQAIDNEQKVVTGLKNIIFANGEVTLTPDTKTYLDALASIIKTDALKNITLPNYFDAQLNETQNKTISDKRATAIINYLIANGCDVKTFNTTNINNFNNSAPNNNGRRIEVEVVNPK